MALRQALQHIQIEPNMTHANDRFSGEEEEGDEWKGPWVFHCAVERYGVDFEFVIWRAEEKEVMERYFDEVEMVEGVGFQVRERGEWEGNTEEQEAEVMKSLVMVVRREGDW